MSWLRRLADNRTTLRILYYVWIAFPFPIRKPLTAFGLLWILGMKKLAGVNRRNAPTPMHELGNLSFWGVPKIDGDRYRLEIDGAVSRPLSLTIDDLAALEAVERSVRMDCVGGFRNNSTMKGVLVTTLLDAAGIKREVEAAVFHCADEYYTAHQVSALLESDAFMAYEIEGQRIDRFGHPLRLVAPGTYGYKWAKWVVRIELVTDFPAGYWERRGLPKRGKIGDIW